MWSYISDKIVGAGTAEETRYKARMARHAAAYRRSFASHEEHLKKASLYKRLNGKAPSDLPERDAYHTISATKYAEMPEATSPRQYLNYDELLKLEEDQRKQFKEAVVEITRTTQTYGFCSILKAKPIPWPRRKDGSYSPDEDLPVGWGIREDPPARKSAVALSNMRTEMYIKAFGSQNASDNTESRVSEESKSSTTSSNLYIGFGDHEVHHTTYTCGPLERADSTSSAGGQTSISMERSDSASCVDSDNKVIDTQIDQAAERCGASGTARKRALRNGSDASQVEAGAIRFKRQAVSTHITGGSLIRAHLHTSCSAKSLGRDGKAASHTRRLHSTGGRRMVVDDKDCENAIGSSSESGDDDLGTSVDSDGLEQDFWDKPLTVQTSGCLVVSSGYAQEDIVCAKSEEAQGSSDAAASGMDGQDDAGHYDTATDQTDFPGTSPELGVFLSHLEGVDAERTSDTSAERDNKTANNAGLAVLHEQPGKEDTKSPSSGLPHCLESGQDDAQGTGKTTSGTGTTQSHKVPASSVKVPPPALVSGHRRSRSKKSVSWVDQIPEGSAQAKSQSALCVGTPHPFWDDPATQPLITHAPVTYAPTARDAAKPQFPQFEQRGGVPLRGVQQQTPRLATKSVLRTRRPSKLLPTFLEKSPVVCDRVG